MIQNSSSTTQSASGIPKADRLPWGSLLALAMAVFICYLTETLPAGLLPQISLFLSQLSLKESNVWKIKELLRNTAPSSHLRKSASKRLYAAQDHKMQ